MKSLLTFTLLIFPGLAMAAPIQVLNNPQGLYHGNEVEDVKNGQIWHAIIPTPGGSQAQQTTLKVENTEDAIMDPEKGPFTGKDITTDLKPEPIFLLRGLPLKEGPLLTASTSSTQLTPIPLTLTTPSTTIILKTQSNGRALDQYNAGYEKNYRVIATINGLSTTLIGPFNSYGGSETLLWAGDLNADNIPDLVLEVGEENASTINLFLSTPTKTGPVYRKAAERTTTGC